MLTEELRAIILKITEDPLYVKPSAIEIPLKLNRRLRGYFITQLRTRRDKYAASSETIEKLRAKVRCEMAMPQTRLFAIEIKC